MQLVGIASGGKPYESSHNCFNGVKVDFHNKCDDEVVVEDLESFPNNSPRLSTQRSNKYHRMSTGGSIVWKRPPNETYEERRERIFKASTATQESYIDFSKVKVEETKLQGDSPVIMKSSVHIRGKESND